LLLDGGGNVDSLVYQTGGVVVTTEPGPGAGQTTVHHPGAGTVVYQNFEDVSFTFSGIHIVKSSNGTDNDGAPGPTVEVGSTVTFTYVVTNTGNVPLTNVAVVDDNGTAADTADDFNPTFTGGDTNGNGFLDSNETWTYTATSIATTGQYTNVGKATGLPSDGSPAVSESNSDNYFGHATPTPTPPAQSLNISTRLRVETGDNVLIGGFIVTGTQPKRIIIRAIGPSLPVSDTLADPLLEVYDGAGQLLASNDNWVDSADKQAIIDSTIPPSSDFEAAVIGNAVPGRYTAIVRGVNESTGVGLIEVYDLDTTVDSQLANISTRGLVQTGDKVMIGGFILGGSAGETRLALRGIGPSLAQAGVANVLADPTLDLRDSNGTQLQFNDNWTDDPTQAAQLAANGLAPSNTFEAGIFTTLPPGPFTVILSGKDGGIGVGLVEVYNLK
jgi:hypothetical protein